MLQAVRQTSKERNWEKHHTPKNLAMDLVREASEALEHFVWATNEEIKKDKKRIKKIQDELGDVLHSMLLLADVLKIDLPKSFWQKLEKVKKRYPADKVYGQTGYEYKNRRN
ncbi:nucleotide pyrophosphohydrolase [Patescibacteria group bacterium]|nr:nucleotide pyrophosphohydrolase [Patescibacteria group bacterium]MBU1931257.1 nucleotide pyrophosphohydrolase [Patescibacteria group bacterium]